MLKRLALLSLLAVGAFAQERSFSTSISAVGTTASHLVDAQNHNLSVVVSGSPSSCTILLEGSHNNVDWFDISQGGGDCTSKRQIVVDAIPETYVRAHVTVLSGGSSPSLALTYKGAN